jgi:uncharacterized membrane protein YqjE
VSVENRATSWRLEAPGIGELLHRLVGEIKVMLDQRVTLLRLELKEQMATAARDVMLVALGGAAALLGLVLLVLALAVWIGELLGTLAGGLAIVGGVIMLIGVGLALYAVSELRRQRLVPKTREELRRDAQWMKNGT